MSALPPGNVIQVLVALITIDVHNRDIVEALVQGKCTSKSDFTWQMQLRYEYDVEADMVAIRQVNARYVVAVLCYAML